MAEESVAEASRRVARLFNAAGIDTPERDARLLIAAAIAARPADLLLRPGRAFDAQETERLNAYVARRTRREPVSRILGSREFYGREFVISPATLDPRPCSETVVSAALDLIDASGGRDKNWRILDIGTGTGCLAITLLAELPNASATATDVSSDALAIAGRNADLLGVASRLDLIQRRTLHDVSGPFDILISNPPYIPAGDIAGLDAEVKDYDPRGALDGGADGLELYRDIARDLASVVPAGWAVFEVGAGQARDVEAILRKALPSGATAHCRTWVDLGGHTRCVAIETHP